MSVSPSSFALHPDRLFPADPETRDIARRLYASVAGLPIVSPHGHTDPQWFADDAPFPDPARLFIVPDHYVHRMLYSQGMRLEELGIPRLDGGPVETDPRKIWRMFAENYHLFRGTPSWLWLDHAFTEVFGFHERLAAENADRIYDHIAACLERPEFRPRALFERFNIEALTTTESPLDDLRHHRKIKSSGWRGRVLTAFRPDPVVDPAFPGFRREPRGTRAHRRLRRLDLRRLSRRARQAPRLFKSVGCTSTDHGHPTARTADLQKIEAAALYGRVRSGGASAADAELFRAQMLTEMARHEPRGRARHADPSGLGARPQSRGLPRLRQGQGLRHPVRDRLRVRAEAAARPVRQRARSDDHPLHPRRDRLFARTRPARRPLSGAEARAALVVPRQPGRHAAAIARAVTETAGFYNTVGFNDDTRAFLSIPARHDMSRRVDCAFLARLVAEHRLELDEAFEVAHDLAYGLAKSAYKL